MYSDKLKPETKFIGIDDTTLGDFWSWAYSDMLSNGNRSILAEFLVGKALDVVYDPRIEWDAIDFRYGNKKIEVKCSAFLQSWPQKKLSEIFYDIAKKNAWDAETNVYSIEPVRSADCYVFCLYPEKDKDNINLLDVNSWEFYVLSTRILDEEFRDQKKIGIKRLQDLCKPVRYCDLKTTIDIALKI